MKKSREIKISLVLVAFISFSGCGGSDKNNIDFSQLKQESKGDLEDISVKRSNKDEVKVENTTIIRKSTHINADTTSVEENKGIDINLGSEKKNLKMKLDDDNLDFQLGSKDKNMSIKLGKDGLKIHLGDDKKGLSINLGDLIKY